MDNLIEALTIFKKYLSGYNLEYPTHCEHDVLMVVGVQRGDVTGDDMVRLEELSFTWDEAYDCFTSSRFGSC